MNVSCVSYSACSILLRQPLSRSHSPLASLEEHGPAVLLGTSRTHYNKLFLSPASWQVTLLPLPSGVNLFGLTVCVRLVQEGESRLHRCG